MMMNSVAASGMRVLSDTEVAMIAGGPDSPDSGGGLNGLVNWANAQWQDSEHTFLISDGRIFADYTHDGIFDRAWQPDATCTQAGGWAQSDTGIMWYCGTNGAQELQDWLEQHPGWVFDTYY
jgi:hypothetical protein